MNIPAGYEVDTGRPISVPLRHMVVLGQTQESGKTTTQEAIIMRSGARAVAFITKRGEKSFRVSNPIPPFFKDATTGPFWKYVLGIMEGMLEIKLGPMERGLLMKLCDAYTGVYNKSEMVPAKGKKKKDGEVKVIKHSVRYEWPAPKTLQDLRANIEIARQPGIMRGANEVIVMQLREYLDQVLPEIQSLSSSKKLHLARGINVMDLSRFSTPVQALIIRSSIEYVHENAENTIVIIPEAWKFIPRHTTPVKQAAERLIREGAALKNFVWLDSQDMRGVDPLLLRSFTVWLFGVQREKNEVEGTLQSIPDLPRPTARDIQSLKKGQFYVAHHDVCTKTYIRPHGMEEEHARSIARGEESAESWIQIARTLDSEDQQEVSELSESGEKDSVDTDGDSAGSEEDWTATSAAIDGPVRFSRSAESKSGSQCQDADIGDLSERRDSSNREIAGGGIPATTVDEIRTPPGDDVHSQGDNAGTATQPDTGSSDDAQDLKAKWDATKKIFPNEIPTSALYEIVEKLSAQVAELRHELTLLKTQPTNSQLYEKEMLSTLERKPMPEPKITTRPTDIGDREELWRWIKSRILADAQIIHVLAQKPEIVVNSPRPTVEMSTSTLKGCVAKLIAEKFFDRPRAREEFKAECVRRGWSTPKNPNDRFATALWDLCSMGFLTNEETGYQAVAGMKVRITE